MTARVLFTDLSVFARMFPLTAGYLEAYATREPDLRRAFSFEVLARRLRTPREELLRELLGAEAEVYAFACYVWNTGVVRHLVRELRRARPGAQVLLGGPQVIGHAGLYLEPGDEGVHVCEGEGEVVFRDYLSALRYGEPLERVPGLSLRRDGELVSTGPAPAIDDLDTIPSPFSSRLLRPHEYACTVFETNRGCPYRCSFCYWGRGDDLTVRRFDEARVRDDLERIARAGITYVFLGDANWGLLKRDLELTRQIVECKRRHGAPLLVQFSAAKDKVERSAEITRILHEAEIVTSQAIGLQTLAPDALDRVQRRNVSLEALGRVRADLEASGIATFTELIWPLPGETLESFAAGVESLCERQVSTVVVYPCTLLHTTPMEAQAEELGLVTRPTLDEDDELELVVATREVAERRYEEGLWLAFGLYALYDLHALRHVGRHLRRAGRSRWTELFGDFASCCRGSDHPVAEAWRRVLAGRRQSDFAVLGLLTHDVLHAERSSFGELLRAFAASRPWWSDEEARALFEVDAVARPYVYASTPLDAAAPGEHVSLLGVERRALLVELSPVARRALERLGCAPASPSGRYRIDHGRLQFPLVPARSPEENAAYCHGMLQRVTAMLPRWTAVES